ncbi:MAG: tetratricopeptide repeat protein [bacterium]|nr:tetratricopeptide repeat protein [bacterium]
MTPLLRKPNAANSQTLKKNTQLSAGAARIQAARNRIRDTRDASTVSRTNGSDTSEVKPTGIRPQGTQSKTLDRLGPKTLTKIDDKGQINKRAFDKPTIQKREEKRSATARKDYIASLDASAIPGGVLTAGPGSRPNTRLGSSSLRNGQGLGVGGGAITTGSGHGRNLWSNQGYNYHHDPYSNYYWNWNMWGSGYGWFWCPTQWATSCWWDCYWYNGGYWNCGYRPSFYYCGPFTSPSYSVIVQVNESPIVIEDTEPAPQAQVAEAVARVPAVVPAINRAAEYYLTLGDRAFRSGRYSDAVHHYGKAVEYSPTEGILYLILSDALFATSDYHYGAFVLRKALELDPALVDLTVDKRGFYDRPADLDAQMTRARTFVLQNPDDQDARLMLIANEIFTGNPSGALGLLMQPASKTTAQSSAGILLQERARLEMERIQIQAPPAGGKAAFETLPPGQK